MTSLFFAVFFFSHNIFFTEFQQDYQQKKDTAFFGGQSLSKDEEKMIQ
jgi:hypothetical protein